MPSPKPAPVPPAARRIVQAANRLTLPSSFFSGLTIESSFAPDNIIFFQRTDASAFKPTGVSSNFHHRFELVVVLEKAGAVRVDRTSYQLHPGEALLIFPNQFHHCMDVEHGRLDWLFITFETAHGEALAPLLNAPRTLDDESFSLLEKLVQERMKPAGKPVDVLEISYLITRLLLRLARAPEIDSARRDIHSSDDVRDVLLEKINAYVRENLHRAITISNLADELGYSVSHLRAVFRDRLGVSLGRYMRESRLSQAAQLLQNGELNVSEVGEKCGFESLYAFSRAFRKAYGLPPRTYRNVVANGEPLPGERQDP